MLASTQSGRMILNVPRVFCLLNAGMARGEGVVRTLSPFLLEG